MHFGRVEAHRPLVDRIRQPRQVFRHAGNAEQTVDLVVVGHDVGVGNRPVDAIAVAARRLEIVVGKPQRQPSPHIGLAAEHARAHPGEIGAGVGMLFLVDEELLGVVRAFAELLPAHHIGVTAEALRIRRLESLVVGLVEHVGVGRKFATARMVVRPLQRAHFGLEVHLPPGFQEQHIEAVSGERMRRHAASRPRADDQHVVDFGEANRRRLRQRHRWQANESHGHSSLGLIRRQSTIGRGMPSAALTQLRGKVKSPQRQGWSGRLPVGPSTAGGLRQLSRRGAK
jgi:hypothetical protein